MIQDAIIKLVLTLKNEHEGLNNEKLTSLDYATMKNNMEETMKHMVDQQETINEINEMLIDIKIRLNQFHPAIPAPSIFIVLGST